MGASHTPRPTTRALPKPPPRRDKLVSIVLDPDATQGAGFLGETSCCSAGWTTRAMTSNQTAPSPLPHLFFHFPLTASFLLSLPIS